MNLSKTSNEMRIRMTGKRTKEFWYRLDVNSERTVHSPPIFALRHVKCLTNLSEQYSVKDKCNALQM